MLLKLIQIPICIVWKIFKWKPTKVTLNWKDWKDGSSWNIFLSEEETPNSIYRCIFCKQFESAYLCFVNQYTKQAWPNCCPSKNFYGHQCWQNAERSFCAARNTILISKFGTQAKKYGHPWYRVYQGFRLWWRKRNEYFQKRFCSEQYFLGQLG